MVFIKYTNNKLAHLEQKLLKFLFIVKIFFWELMIWGGNVVCGGNETFLGVNPLIRDVEFKFKHLK